MGRKEWEPESVLDVFGSEYARQILALASVEPMSAEELAEHCDVSLPTIYRRVNALLEYDLLQEETEIDADGAHYKVFETNLKRICFEVEDGGFAIDIELEQDVVDQFTDFWDDLDESRSDVDIDQ